MFSSMTWGSVPGAAPGGSITPACPAGWTASTPVPRTVVAVRFGQSPSGTTPAMPWNPDGSVVGASWIRRSLALFVNAQTQNGAAYASTSRCTVVASLPIGLRKATHGVAKRTYGGMSGGMVCSLLTTTKNRGRRSSGLNVAVITSAVRTMAVRTTRARWGRRWARRGMRTGKVMKKRSDWRKVSWG